MKKGFTLQEMLLVIALMAIMAVISVPIYQSFQVKNDVDLVVNAVASTARRAQVLSQGSSEDSSWGIKLTSTAVILFKGAAYAARDVNFDETFDVPVTITGSGTTEFVFAKFTGFPLAAGTATLTTSTNEIRNIAINSYGTVSY
ncbi:MAG: type II secretion system protein [Candidatus Gracilibacteria bacterium]